MPKFTRGVYILPDKQAASRPIQKITDIRRLLLPLTYRADSRPAADFARYDAVMRGQPLCHRSSDEDIVPVSSVNGIALEEVDVFHPLYGPLRCLAVDCLLASEEEESAPREIKNLSSSAILRLCREAAIIDELDGRPLFQKLEEAANSACRLLTADAVEQQPYQDCQRAVLTAYAPQITEGLALAARACDAAQAGFAISCRGRQRKELLRLLPKESVYTVPRRYPATQRGPKPLESATMCIGVQACLALYRAAAFEEPHCDGFVTVAGDAVRVPQNVCVPFGTSLEDLLRHCGLVTTPSYVIVGDALTGYTVSTLDLPVLPGTTCVLAMTKRHTLTNATACIGCGRCAQVCPHALLPYEIARRLENLQYNRLGELDADRCNACGACSYVCPAGRDVAAKVMEAAQSNGIVLGGLEDGQ